MFHFFVLVSFPLILHLILSPSLSSFCLSSPHFSPSTFSPPPPNRYLQVPPSPLGVAFSPRKSHSPAGVEEQVKEKAEKE